ncbi:MAG TPA: hypothetical protein VEW06_06285 [Xanthobacteraceae bacterium]|nr:hypothetical protein [Xanthobacteraceae bacterium]
MAARFRLTAPEPAERDIHEAVAKALDLLLLAPAFWACYPAGASVLTPQQQARHSRAGLKRGLPDIWVLHGRLWLVELKRRGGRLSRTRIVRTKRGAPRVLAGQEDVFPLLVATGAVGGIAICTSVMEVLEQLVQWGVPLRPFHGASGAANVKRRSCEDRRFGGGCDAQASQALAEDYRGSARQNQDRPLVSEDGQPVSGRVGLPPEWQQQDSRDSYDVAIKAIGANVKNGAEVPQCLLPLPKGRP